MGRRKHARFQIYFTFLKFPALLTLQYCPPDRWRSKVPSMDPNLARHYGHYYETGASEWRRLGAIDKARNIIGRCDGMDIDSVVEIGAGDGAVLHQLSGTNFARSYSALEVSESAVKVIRDRGIDGLREVTLFDGYDAPIEDGKYDLAVLSHVVEHVEHPRMLLREAARVADYVYVEVPLELKLRAPRDFKWTSTGHINIYSSLTTRHLVQSTGLSIVEERVTNPSFDVYRFGRGKQALTHFAIKATALRIMPPIATRLFTYHWSALCKPSGDLLARP